MKNRKRINVSRTQLSFARPCLLLMLASSLAIALPSPTNADFILLSRNSQIALDTTNFGGIEQMISTTSLDAPFQHQLVDSTEHIEIGGHINGAIWDLGQDSTVSPDLIRADMHAEAVTVHISGMGTGILNLDSYFDVEFQVTEETNIELGGTYYGTSDTLFADDFVRIQLQRDNGVTFITMFQTSTNDDLNNPFQATLVPGTTYRLEVQSNAYSMGEGAAASGASVCLRPQILTGDMNLDGSVDLLDVSAFVNAISQGAYQSEADVNCDGVVSLLDVEPFVQLLTGG